jgi:hypothetical protein
MARPTRFRRLADATDTAAILGRRPERSSPPWWTDPSAPRRASGALCACSGWSWDSSRRSGGPPRLGTPSASGRMPLLARRRALAPSGGVAGFGPATAPTRRRQDARGAGTSGPIERSAGRRSWGGLADVVRVRRDGGNGKDSRRSDDSQQVVRPTLRRVRQDVPAGPRLQSVDQDPPLTIEQP